MNPSDRKWLRSPSERVGTLSHAALPPPAAATSHEEQQLLRALRDGDEAAFEWLLDRHYSPMFRLARSYVRSREEAEEVVQDTWLAVLAGLDRFEGRSSLKTWIFRILVNRARTRASREARQVPFSSLSQRTDGPGPEAEGAAPEWLFAAGAATPLTWHGDSMVSPCPEELTLSGELRARIEAAIEALPARQREVITLRDVEGWPAPEVCELLGVTDGNQRLLLHRARLKVRQALEGYLASPDADDMLAVPAR